MVKVRNTLPGKLEMLPLVLAHRHMGSPMNKNISSLEDRIRKQPVLECAQDLFLLERRIIRDGYLALFIVFVSFHSSYFHR